NQVLEVPSQSIQSPAHQYVEPPAFGVGEHLIERGASILRPAHSAIHVLHDRPAACPGISTQFGELVLRLLIECRDTGVDRGLHDWPPSVVPALRIWSATFRIFCAERSG